MATKLDVLAKLEKRMAKLEERSAATPFIVPIITLAPSPYKLRRDLPVLIRPTGDDYIASFVDANISTSGETVVEAIDNLKDLIVALYEKFRSLPSSQLGPYPAKQLAVLKDIFAA